MPGKNRPDLAQLFPGLERRASEARERAAEAEAVAEPTTGRGRRAVLRTQDEIEADLRALSSQEREEILSSSHLVADAAGLREQIQYVDLDRVQPNPTQPRKTFDPLKMEELVESVRANGVLSPIQVRALPDGTFQIIAGERRWRAARKAGRTNIPVIVKNVDDQQALELALLENLQREDLSALDEARTYRFMREQFGYTQAQLAERIGKKQAYISKMIGLLDLAPAVQALLAPLGEAGATHIPHGIEEDDLPGGGLLSTGAAMVLSRVTDPDAQARLAHLVVEEGLTVRQVEALVRDWKQLRAAGTSAPPAPAEVAPPEPVAPVPEAARPARTAAPPPMTLRPDPAGPAVRFADLSLFRLYREVGRVSHIDLARLADALEHDLAVVRALQTQEGEQSPSA